MKVRPLGDKLIIKRADAQAKTDAGIYLPESAKEKPMQGEVVAIGPGKLLDSGERVKPSVKTGDTVVFSKYAGTEIDLDDDTHIIMRETDLLGLIEL